MRNTKLANYVWWKRLNEAELQPPAPESPQMPPPAMDPAAPPQEPPQPPPVGEAPPEDPANDPQQPEMPEQDEEPDFEQWRAEFVKASIKGDPLVLQDMIMQVRDKELEPNPRKFVEDNLQICFMRIRQDILQPSQKLRKSIKDELDMNLPATSLVTHLSAILDENPLLNTIFIKLLGTGGGKQDYHRKFLAALLGAIQVGSGHWNEDLVFEETEYSIPISTRFASKWGEINLGRWTLTEEDPERYLKPDERERLEGGSPEERDVLRRRVVIESLSHQFKTRAFLIDVVGNDGTVQHIGMDLGNLLRSSYLDGKLVVRMSQGDNQEAFIDDKGSITVVPQMAIYFVKETGQIDAKGKPATEEIEFFQHRGGDLYLSAPLDVIKEASTPLQGIVFKETPWQGNPSDLQRVMRSVPTVGDILFRDPN